MTKEIEDWSAVDWSYPDPDIAEGTTHTSQYVHQRRRELCQPPPTKFKRKIRETWGVVDWSKSDVMLAKEMNVDRCLAGYWRKRITQPPGSVRHDYNPVNGPHKFRYKIKDFESIDWTRQDVVIAERHGVSRERIRQLRKMLQKPKPDRFRHHSESSSYFKRTQKRVAILNRNRRRFKNMGIQSIAKVLKATVVEAGRLVREHKVEHRDERLYWDWTLVNFDLPNSTIEEIWNMSASLAATKRCNTNPHHDAKWSRSWGIVKPVEDLKAYHKAVRVEKIKAARWFKQCPKGVIKFSK